MIAAGSLRVFVAVSLAAASLCPGAWASAWALDPSATRIEFSVRNLSVARIDGTFRLASGHVTLDDGDPSRSTLRTSPMISAATITPTPWIAVSVVPVVGTSARRRFSSTRTMRVCRRN